MPFSSMRGVAGMIFVPRDSKRNTKKHRCADCFACQMCSDDRCAACLKAKRCRERSGGAARR
jgi:hypothetical protein